jgi:PTS system sorbose subfamily IIB component.
MIVLTRIDGRLIHGQVAVAWTRLVGAEEIYVVDDKVVNDEMQKMLLKMATPPGVKLNIVSTADAIVKLKDTGSKKIFVVVKEPETIKELVKAGIPIKELNVGGMYHAEGKRQYEKALFLDEYDISIFNELEDMGVDIYYQVAPMNNRINLFELIK